MSPMVTGTPSAPGLARSCSTMCGDSSMPVDRDPPGAQRQRDPAGADGELERRARRRASSASRSTIGSSTAGSNIAAEVAS